jgi:inosose dehydratase
MGSDSGNGLAPVLRRNLAGAPISWGVCEVPGWGRMLAPDRVLEEMASLGLRATELGPIGYLPLDPAPLREQLDRHGLRLVAGFVPLVLHERSLDATLEEAERLAALLEGAGAEVFVAAVVMDAGWSAPVKLDDEQWRRVIAGLDTVRELAGRHGLTLALHPHAGTLLEKADDIERVVADSDVPLCLDTGHYAIAGLDVPAFVEREGSRIVHVHLKDVDAEVAAQVREGALSLTEATRLGLFRPLGTGDAEIDEVVGLLDAHGYDRWFVLEQDTSITGEEPPVGLGPVVDVRASIEYLSKLAPTTGGGVPRS